MAIEKKEECKGAPSWLTSFGDLMSLLLTFFILLYSMSTISLEKFYQALKGIIEAFGGHYIIYEEKMINGRRINTEFPDMFPKQRIHTKIQKQALKIKNLLKRAGIQAQVKTFGSTLRIRINTDKLFPPGSAKPYKEAIPLIMEICRKLRNFDLTITIEGHTDNTPIHTSRFPSNWELSAARAVNILRMFIMCGYNPAKISAEGCGEHRPIAPNTTENGRQKNRRIEIVIKLPL